MATDNEYRYFHLIILLYFINLFIIIFIYMYIYLILYCILLIKISNIHIKDTKLIKHIARWVVGLLQGLIEAKKFTVLARITITSVEPGMRGKRRKSERQRGGNRRGGESARGVKRGREEAENR